MLPPLEFVALDVPPAILTNAPSPTSPTPGTTSMFPPAPLVALPVLIDTLPLAPADEIPEAIVTAPLTPLVPLLADSSINDPLDVALPLPVRIVTDPPVAPLLIPP